MGIDTQKTVCEVVDGLQGSPIFAAPSFFSGLPGMPAFNRLFVTGRDRARFLHNFCTNDVVGLPAGQAVEAFFTDVKARVLAHGYVLAFADHHEILLLSADTEPLRRHLERYIITEDVQLEIVASSETYFLTQEHALQRLITPLSQVPDQSGQCCSYSLSEGRLTALSIRWFQTALCVLCGSEAVLQSLTADLASIKLSATQMQTLRIRERFPIVGVDLTSEHLAPEADRNATAISFKKGCYLGQEPIARIDALGHINRGLRCVTAQVDPGTEPGENMVVQHDNGTVLGTITSLVRLSSQAWTGLAILRLASLDRPAIVIDSAGGEFPVVNISI
ncbi:MAG: tRNA-modifying protein YgfZ [Planctomycetota bacterium]|jgi:folate-binding protein YgfZ